MSNANSGKTNWDLSGHFNWELVARGEEGCSLLPVAFNLKRLLRLSNEYSALMMMIIAPNSRAHKGKKERGDVKEEYEGVCGEEERNADYGGIWYERFKYVDH